AETKKWGQTPRSDPIFRDGNVYVVLADAFTAVGGAPCGPPGWNAPAGGPPCAGAPAGGPPRGVPVRGPPVGGVPACGTCGTVPAGGAPAGGIGCPAGACARTSADIANTPRVATNSRFMKPS